MLTLLVTAAKYLSFSSGCQSPFTASMRLSITRQLICTTIRTSSHSAFVFSCFCFNSCYLYYQGYKNNINTDLYQVTTLDALKIKVTWCAYAMTISCIATKWIVTSKYIGDQYFKYGANLAKSKGILHHIRRFLSVTDNRHTHGRTVIFIINYRKHWCYASTT